MQREGVERVLAFARGAREFQVQAFAGGALPLREPLFGEFVLARGGEAPGFAVAAGEREQAVVGLAQPLRAHDDAIVAMAFHPRAREQARQAQVAVAVAAQQGHARGRFVAVGEQQVGAGDRLEPGAFGRLVELHQREQVVLVGDRDRRLPVRHAATDQLRDADGRVGQRVLAVQVEVGECGHAASV